MFPKPIPQEPGCVCVLVRAGSFPVSISGPCIVSFGGHTFQSSLSSIGASEPAIWRCCVWTAGAAYVAELHSDVPRIPSLTELMMHLAEHHDVWKLTHENPA